MDYSLRFILSPLAGGVGIVGRFIIALAILAALKFVDKSNTAVDKGIRKLLTGRIITALLFVFLVALVAGMYIAGFTIPFWYFLD